MIKKNFISLYYYFQNFLVYHVILLIFIQIFNFFIGLLKNDILEALFLIYNYN